MLNNICSYISSYRHLIKGGPMQTAFYMQKHSSVKQSLGLKLPPAENIWHIMKQRQTNPQPVMKLSSNLSKDEQYFSLSYRRQCRQLEILTLMLKESLNCPFCFILLHSTKNEPYISKQAKLHFFISLYSIFLSFYSVPTQIIYKTWTQPP